MKKILLLQCSPKIYGSYSGSIAREFAEGLKNVFPSSEIVNRDLGLIPIPHVTSQHTYASEKRESMLSLADQEALKLSNILIEELESSDALIIATPMHNFTIPSVLKAWIDHVVRAHRTIKLTPKGKLGLIGDKKTYIFVSSGGHHTQQPAWQPDFLTPYLLEILRTIGITSVQFVYLKAMNHGAEVVELALEKARFKIIEIISRM